MRRPREEKSRACAARTGAKCCASGRQSLGANHCATPRRLRLCAVFAGLHFYIFTWFCTVFDGTKLISQVPILYRVFEYKWRRGCAASAMASHNE